MVTFDQFRPFVNSLLDVLSVSSIRQIARETEFVKRLKKVKPEDFLSVSAFSDSTVGSRSLDQLAASLSRESSVSLSKQAMHQRLNARGVAFLKQLFLKLANQQQPNALSALTHEPFSRLRILDSTAFEEDSQQPQTANGASIQLEYEPVQGAFLHTLLYPTRTSDHHAAAALEETIQPGDLILRDLGYYSAKSIRRISQKGGRVITRVPSNTTFWTTGADHQPKEKVRPEEDAKHLQPGERYDYGFLQVGTGTTACSMRVVVQRLTPSQQKQRDAYLNERRRKGSHTQSARRKRTIPVLVTNVTQEEMDAQRLYPIYSLRWQVKILFKTWKSFFEIDQFHHMNEDRFYCHLYGTLIHILLSSMLAFRCRYMLYRTRHMEVSEYKAIQHARNAVVEEKGSVLYHRRSLFTLIKNIYENISRHGRKDHRSGHQSPLDILNIPYKSR